jgi:hypothetical protein
MDEEDNETWLLERGDDVIKQKADLGFGSLATLKRLIYCLWVADYGMRSAGDLTTSGDLFPTFHDDALLAARELGLQQSAFAFSLSKSELEHRYFEVFDAVCQEIRAVYQ